MISEPACPRPKVVVVDHDEAVRRALTFALELDGYEVRTLDSAEALLASALPEAGACLVVDQRLPGLTGLEALAVLRSRRVSLPAVLMSGQPRRALRAEAAAAGVPIVEKPLMGEALTLAIAAALSA